MKDLMILKHSDFLEYVSLYHFNDKYRLASLYEDLHQCTDIHIGDYNVAVRIRKNIKFRDFTIRHTNNGYNTLKNKILNGNVDYYIYAWLNALLKICLYILVDMKSAISDRNFRHIINNRLPISNGDGSAHIAIRLWLILLHIIDHALLLDYTND